ncbi:MAG TPA: hypothetical protein VNM92_13860 [Thermoanaerobaculia bacterium]|nr:hypothetical protein [Thermoanaerobaculia bacterium]
MGLDFNAAPTAAVFAHPLRPGEYPSEHEREGLEHIGFFGEFFDAAGMDSHTLAERLITGQGGNFPSNWKGLREHQAPVHVYGDATGRSRSMASAGTESNWSIVSRVFSELGRRFILTVPSVNPTIVLSVRALNAKLENALGVRSCWIDPVFCPELIRDCMSVTLTSDGLDIVKHARSSGSGDERWKRSHLSDSARYIVSARYAALAKPQGRSFSRENMAEMADRLRPAGGTSGGSGYGGSGSTFGGRYPGGKLGSGPWGGRGL